MGFKVKYSVNYSKNNITSSLFSTDKIKKGQIIYDHKWLAVFPYPKSYITFLNYFPPDLACDCMMWGYDMSYGSEDDGSIYIDFDDISYCKGKGETNMDYNADAEMVALRDIDAGEE